MSGDERKYKQEGILKVESIVTTESYYVDVRLAPEYALIFLPCGDGITTIEVYTYLIAILALARVNDSWRS